MVVAPATVGLDVMISTQESKVFRVFPYFSDVGTPLALLLPVVFRGTVEMMEV